MASTKKLTTFAEIEALPKIGASVDLAAVGAILANLRTRSNAGAYDRLALALANYCDLSLAERAAFIRAQGL